ncbi:MAG TPA: bifunctional UDP-sugar hydrolase/5'-nucleotidase [Gemmatimonadaceae bacterium]|nr:bifunctional UDP-sugar hydrolase/5'-nucleotidase [Gemmatimonadaceae bacterium]
MSAACVRRPLAAAALGALAGLAACGPAFAPNASLDVPPLFSSAPAAASGTFTILHTNDIHGDLREFVVDTGDATAQTGDPGRPYQQYPRAGTIGGFARVAGAVERIRRERGRGNVLLLDAGDTFGDQLLSNITRGEATLRLMDALGYQFMALGNHDYEYTAANTRRLQGLVRFPMRAANAIVAATGEPFLGDPTTVITVGGVRVGLLALTYHNTDQTGNKDNTKELRFTSGIDAAKKYVPELRKRADVVVVVSHQGTVVDSILGARVPGIDIIVGGHSHDRIQPPRRVGGAWMVQALSDASALGELTVTVRGGRVSAVTGVVHELYADKYQPDPRFAAMLDSIRAPHRDTLEAVVATAADRIGRQYKSESPVDRLAAEALRSFGKSDVAFLPGLGFGVTIQPGPVTREMVVALFPHPTTVVHEKLTGAQILQVLEQSATNLKPRDDMDRVGGMVQTAGMRWTIDLTRPEGERIRDVSIGGTPLDPAKTYTVMTNGGMLQGTHRYVTFANGTEIERDEVPFAKMLEDALRAMGTIRAPALGDVTLIK